MEQCKLTTSRIKVLPCPAVGQALYWDSEIKGFGVRATAKNKAFILDRKLNGKTVRLTIGRVGDWSADEARKEAKRLVVEIDKGIDPRQQKRKAAAGQKTLNDAFDAFIKDRTLKPRTAYDYTRYIKGESVSGKPDFFNKWLDKPIAEITPEMVKSKYKTLTASVRGTAQASSAMRTLRSVLNFAIVEFELEIPNPVTTLTKRHLWARANKRRTHLHLQEIRPFVLALRALPNPVMGAYLEFILLTGARRSEAAKLRWQDVNLNAAVFTFTKTKNGTDRTLPISNRVSQLLLKMKKLAMGEYVFASTAKDGSITHVTEPRKALAQANAAAGTAVTAHDLRRTFATVMELQDCPMTPLKAMLGHLEKDVTTGHYVVIGIERLRPWCSKYDAFLQHLIDTNPQDTVTELKARTVQ